jgi:hypothetical protein
MVIARAAGRIGLLVAGLGVGAVFAWVPAIASADSSDWLSSVDSLGSGASVPADTTPLDIQISVNGSDLFSTTGNEASATSGQGDIAIAIGDGASANATGGTGDYALADGTNAVASAGADGGTSTDSNYDIAQVIEPFNAGDNGTADTAIAGGIGETEGSYDFASVVGVESTTATAQGADYTYDMVNLLLGATGSDATLSGLLGEILGSLL